MKEDFSYKHIFKTTFLFGFVQVFNILVKLGTNKAIAIFLGAEGMGIIGLFNSTINLLKTGCGLGISQSAVRNISEANSCLDNNSHSRIISVTNKVLHITALLGSIITVILSPWLSIWTFGDKSFTIAFIWLALVVGMNILMEGKLAILTGMRQLRALAKASMIGSSVGLVTSVPFYYFFGKAGIVPSIFITAFSALFFSIFFVNKIKYKNSKLALKELFMEASPLVKMGIALMLASFLFSIASLVISAYIRHKGGLSNVGYYQAGTTIISGYFGIIISALTTDYYPRIAAVNKNNQLLNEELNKQSLVSLVFICPLIVAFIFLMSHFIKLLYSESFMPTIDYIRFAVFGMLIRICSNQVEMILVAKFQIKIYLILQFFYRMSDILLNVYLFKLFGLKGTGFCYIIIGIIYFIIVQLVVYKLYSINYNMRFLKIFLIVLIVSLITAFINNYDNEVIKNIGGCFMTLLSLSLSIIVTKSIFNIDVFGIVLTKFNLKK
jgi:O-antigen/teichoic acid export membrane protein